MGTEQILREPPSAWQRDVRYVAGRAYRDPTHPRLTVSDGLMTTALGEHNTESPSEKDSKGGVLKREPGSETHTNMFYLGLP